MQLNLLTHQRTVRGRPVREPTLLALGLVVAGLPGLLLVCLVAIAGLPAFGLQGWALAAVAGLLAPLLLAPRRKRPAAPTTRQLWLCRILRGGRLLFSVVLAGWLALLVWLALGPGGPAPPGKADSDLVRVVTWNIHCGQDHGLPWKQFDWPARKHALRSALEQARPDILCVQEATPVQVAFLEKVLPEHGRVGIGRDGAAAGGEHCAVFFHRERFAHLAGDTFWLEEPTDQPRAGSALDVKRICTWVRLRDRPSGRTLRIYNTHLYLTEAPRRTAVRLILDHIAAGDPKDAVLLTADFNASPSAPSRRLFLDAGLADSAALAGRRPGTPTFQLYGFGLWCIDGILVDSHWHVANHLVLRVKPHNTFPSDHFALLADLELR